MLITKRQRACTKKVCVHCEDWVTVIKCIKCKKYNWIPTCGNENKSFNYEVGVCWNCKERFWACHISDLIQGLPVQKNLNLLLNSNELNIKEASQFPPLWIAKIVSMSFDNMENMKDYTKNKKTDNKKKIFICDDDVSLLTMLSLFLNKNGFNTSIATCYSELKEQLQQQSPDLLLLDVYLPEHNGFWIQEELEYLGYTMPIILMTASDDTFKNQAPLTDVAERLLKPFNLSELLSMVQKHTSK